MMGKSGQRILVTGGAGFIGCNLVPLIRDKVTVYDNLCYANEYFENVDFIHGDVTDFKKLKEALKKVDTVVWLAGIVGDAACNVNPSRAIATDVEALQVMADNFDGKIIFMSSCSTYGRNEEVTTEESKLNPLSLYAENKIKGEKILKDKNAYILRLGTLHGASQRMRFDLVVNVLTMHAVCNKRIEIFGGKQYRPLLSVKDVALFIKQLTENDYTPGIYNVASENLAIIDVGNMIKEIIPETEVKLLDSEFEDHRNYRVDFSKAERELNFKAKNFVRDSIRDIMHMLQSGRIKNTFLPQYINHATLNNSEERQYAKS